MSDHAAAAVKMRGLAHRSTRPESAPHTYALLAIESRLAQIAELMTPPPASVKRHPVYEQAPPGSTPARSSGWAPRWFPTIEDAARWLSFDAPEELVGQHALTSAANQAAGLGAPDVDAPPGWDVETLTARDPVSVFAEWLRWRAVHEGLAG